MNDAVYWSARVGLAVGWLLVAIGCWRQAPPRGWRIAAVAAAVFASVRALRWNYGLLLGARELLFAAGVYDDRIVGKLALGALLVVAIAFAVVALRRVGAPALRTTLAGVALQAALVLVETCSLDDAMPRWTMQQPGRYLVEGAFLAISSFGVRRAMRTARRQ